MEGSNTGPSARNSARSVRASVPMTRVQMARPSAVRTTTSWAPTTRCRAVTTWSRDTAKPLPTRVSGSDSDTFTTTGATEAYTDA